MGFLRDMTERGLRTPLLYCSDDCPGLRKALKAVWPKSLAQKCQAHKMRNILSKLPRGVQGELTKQIQRVFRAKDYEEGLRRGRALVEQYRDRYPRAMECLAKSLAECIACLKLPESHRRRVRTTNSLERLIEEARRRTKVIRTLPDERAGLSLVYAVLVDVSRRWRGITISPADLETLSALRAEVAPLAASAEKTRIGVTPELRLQTNRSATQLLQSIGVIRHPQAALNPRRCLERGFDMPTRRNNRLSKQDAILMANQHILELPIQTICPVVGKADVCGAVRRGTEVVGEAAPLDS